MKFDNLFDELNKIIDISQIFLMGQNSICSGSERENDNDKYILSYLKNESFHNGGVFYESFSSFFNVDFINL